MVFAQSHVRRCNLEMPRGRRVDLMALVLPSSMKLRQSQRLGLLYPALTVPGKQWPLSLREGWADHSPIFEVAWS